MKLQYKGTHYASAKVTGQSVIGVVLAAATTYALYKAADAVLTLHQKRRDITSAAGLLYKVDSLEDQLVDDLLQQTTQHCQEVQPGAVDIVHGEAPISDAGSVVCSTALTPYMHSFDYTDNGNASMYVDVEGVIHDNLSSTSENREIAAWMVASNTDTRTIREVLDAITPAASEVAIVPDPEMDHYTFAACHAPHLVKSLLDMVKCRFGTPEDTPASRVAVHRYLHDYLRKRRVRPSQARLVIPRVVELTFIPSQEEVDLIRWGKHPIVRRRKAGRLPSLFERIQDYLFWPSEQEVASCEL